MKRTTFISCIIQFTLGVALVTFIGYGLKTESFFYGFMTFWALVAFVLNIACVKSDNNKDNKD